MSNQQQYMQMMNMMRMMNMMNNNSNFSNRNVFNPNNIEKHFRKQLVNATISKNIIGPYGKLPYFKPRTLTLVRNFTIPDITNICKVTVIHQHSLDAVYNYCEKGIDLRQNTTGYSPVILNVVGQDFSGNIESPDDIRDELIVFRTTFNKVSTSTSGSIFPLNKNSCSYAQIVYTVRSNGPNFVFLPYKDIYRYALISISPQKIDNLLRDEMYSKDFLETINTIELVFQAAIMGKHNVLVLTPFGDNNEDNNPVEDIIKIYNLCIYKYSGYFKEIIFAIPSYYDKEIFDIYNEKIIRPQDVVSKVDEEYEQNKMKNILEKPIKNKNDKKHKHRINHDDSDVDNDENEQYHHNNMNFDPKMMKNMFTMMQMMNKK